jgi:hypothetical protein
MTRDKRKEERMVPAKKKQIYNWEIIVYNTKMQC